MALWLFIIMSITRHYPGGKCAPGQTQDLSRGSNDYQEFLSIPILFSHKQIIKLSSSLSNFFSSTPRFIQILSGTLKQTVQFLFLFKINIGRRYLKHNVFYINRGCFKSSDDILYQTDIYPVQSFIRHYFERYTGRGISCTVDASSVCPRGAYLASDWSLGTDGSL